MPDWIERHRSSIVFVISTTLGILLILLGSGLIIGDSDPALIALGAGALGLQGFYTATSSLGHDASK